MSISPPNDAAVADSPQDPSKTPCDTLEHTEHKEDMFVVGIGVAADGLESLISLFGNLSISQKVAYVIVQCKQLKYHGNILESLTRHTSLKAEIATNGVQIQPNHIYLIPPATAMRLEGGHLVEYQDASGIGLSHPIDTFFLSLAEEVREKSIAVVLTGTGTDGMRGVRAVKEMGGLTIARALDSTRFCGESQPSVVARLCDLELSPGMISVEIINYLKNIDAAAFAVNGSYDEDELLAQIYLRLRKVSAIDFTYYKKDTVRRRISRRMTMYHMKSLQSYVTHLMENKDEARALGKDILIGSTRFFRDSSCFASLNTHVILPLIERTSSDTSIRIWVAGCSTGEEAYSIAILFDEGMRALGKQIPVEIFATDIDTEAISIASRGVYHESIAADVSPERLQRYFTSKSPYYTVCKDIRRMCVFAPHNLFINPPFRSLDLITYRNVHIYLQPILQNVILSAFHSVLKPGGFLFLGRSESVGEQSDVFIPVSTLDRIFYHKPSERRPNPPALLPVPSQDVTPIPVTPGLRPQQRRVLEEDRQRITMEEVFPQILESLHMISILISDSDTIEHLSGDVQRVLHLPRGTASRALYALLEPDLVLPVTTALHSARAQARTISFTDIRLPDGHLFKLTAQPLKNQKGQLLPLLALLFAPMENELLPTKNTKHYNANAAAMQRIKELEQEVIDLRETLEYHLQELKTVNEELQSSNQEMHTSNEELQTSNEELQSVNEELFIVNSEYQIKMMELMELNDDMSNFLNSTMIGLLLVDRNLNIRKFTEYVAAEFGIMEHDIGRSMLHVMKRFTNIDLVETTQRVLQTLTTIQCEARASDGKHYMLRISPYRTLESKINGLVISIVDIEELKGAYSQIEKLSYAIEQMPNIVILTDPEGRVEYVNPRFTAVTGYTSEEMLGKNLRDCLPATLSDAGYADIWDRLQRQEIWTDEVECLKKNGEKYWERLSLLPVVNGESHITNYLKLAEDITAQKLTQLSEVEYRQHLETMVQARTAALEESRNEAQAASIAKTEFLSTMSHEIRTPMNAILGFTHLFNRTNLTSTQLGYLNKIQLSANTLLGIINDVLDIAKIESGKLELCESVFALRTAIDTICSIVDSTASAKGLRLEVEVAEDVPDTLQGDVLRINQILLNLLNNAIKFTAQGTIRLEVVLNPIPDATRPEIELAFSVQDTGIGITEQQLPLIFQSFVQADSTITRKYGGTGLGLAICRRLVELMGGQISVTSHPGAGSCFRFTLRLHPASPVEHHIPECTLQAPVIPHSLRGRRVLVVEDNEINQEIACALLEEYEVEVQRAMNGREAVQKAITTRYDCIFMDMQMPVMDGLDATRHLRALAATAPEHRWLADVPIIAMTANVMLEDKQHSLDAGMNAHMSKPIEPEILKTMLYTWIPDRHEKY